MKLPVVLNSKWNFQGLIKSNVELSGLIKKKSCGMWNFQGSWFYLLKCMMGITQFCEVSRGESLFCLKFLGVKQKTFKFQECFNTTQCVTTFMFGICVIVTCCLLHLCFLLLYLRIENLVY